MMITAEQLRSLPERVVAPSPWVQITQGQVNHFAEITGDAQFIHVDPARASKSQFGGTIAHGFLLLAMLPKLLSLAEALPATSSPRINYGLDKVRFLRPVPVGSHVRASCRVREVLEQSNGMWKVKSEVSLETQGDKKPAMVAVLITLFSIG